VGKRKPIRGFPGYAVTKDGRVWSTPKLGGTKSGQWLIPHSDVSGHLRVWLYRGGEKIGRAVHRLVLETYIGPCPEGMECRHLNGNPTDNNLGNLMWGTRSENQIDSVMHGTAANLKLTVSDIKIIVYMHRTGLFLQREIAEIYRVTQATISDILCKRTWRHLWAE